MRRVTLIQLSTVLGWFETAPLSENDFKRTGRFLNPFKTAFCIYKKIPAHFDAKEIKPLSLIF
jgi:hypothetical protein